MRPLIIKTEDNLRVFSYKNNVFFFEKQDGNIWTRLDTKTFKPVWTKDLAEFNLNECSFYEDFLVAPSRFINLETNEVINFSEKIRNYRWSKSINENFLLFGTRDEKKGEQNGVFDLKNREIKWQKILPITGLGIFSINNLSFFISENLKNGDYDGIISFNYLTGETLWQHSFKELSIDNLDKFIGDIDNILICACGKTILGLDKNTGEIHWKLRHRSEAQYTLLNPSTGCLYQLYGWADSVSNNSLILLEIDAKTGTIIYDESIFKHPNYQQIDNLGTEQDWKYPRFHNAVQWKEKVYFLVNPTGTSWLVNVFEFDCIQKRVTKVSDELYATTNSIFVAEGKLFINSEICKKVASRDNPENDKWSRAISIPRMDGEKEYSEYYAISKESYLTIFDLEDN